MTQSIAIDPDDYDLFLDGNSNLAMVSGVDAIAQNTATAMRALKNEMQYAMQDGMPMFATAFNTYNPIAFEAAARKVIGKVDGVTGITSFAVTRVKNQLVYAANVTTIFGTTTVQGAI
jgi:hypothetical protein